MEQEPRGGGAGPAGVVWSRGRSLIGGHQGSHGHGKSWKILKFETILESHGKVMDFCLFSRSHGKLIFQGKVMEKSWNFTQTVSSVHDVWLWQSCGLHIYKFTTFFHALS